MVSVLNLVTRIAIYIHNLSCTTTFILANIALLSCLHAKETSEWRHRYDFCTVNLTRRPFSFLLFRHSILSSFWSSTVAVVLGSIVKPLLMNQTTKAKRDPTTTTRAAKREQVCIVNVEDFLSQAYCQLSITHPKTSTACIATKSALKRFCLKYTRIMRNITQIYQAQKSSQDIYAPAFMQPRPFYNARAIHEDVGQALTLDFPRNSPHMKSGWSGCRTGNGEKLSNSEVYCLAQLCLAAAQFLSVSCLTSPPSTLQHCITTIILHMIPNGESRKIPRKDNFETPSTFY